MCLVLIGAGVGLWTLADQSGAREPLVQLPEQVDAPMMRGDLTKLQRMTIEQPRYGSSIRVEIQEGDWIMTEPMVDVPEPLAVRFALEVLFGDDWQEAPAEWASQSSEELGLEPASATIDLRYSDGTSEILRIGAQEETGRWRVAERDGELFRFPISPFRQLAQPSEQWRDHRMQPFGVSIDRLLWTPIDGEPIEVVRERSKWYLRKPFSAPLNDSAVPYLMQMLGWRVDSMGVIPKSEYDFSKPLGVMDLYQGNETVQLEVNEDGILSSQRNFPIAYSKRAFHFLELSVDQLRSSRVLDLDADQISSIQIEYGAQKSLYRLHNGGWMESTADNIVEEQSMVVKALLEYATLLERGEEVPLPTEEPAGSILFSISRTPKTRGSIELRWWVGQDGRNIVAPVPATAASYTDVNFELGVRSLLGL
jgi:hypothetical protein